MAVIKCKMCGGDLVLVEGQSVAECEYCGSRQTVPTADNEKKLTLFARANRLRSACEFDKAAGIYESIVADFPEEAEAYWGLVLCKYGIEYVDDPATGKKIPTCHRSSFDSILEDSDFEQACENADTVARKVYREEAKQIEEIRKGIIEVSGKEQPYDIFICYKETDENGERTLDSVLAQDVYDALTDKGYRVFFSRITLEDKLGQEYEPYIFAALNSAKIMLAFGTDYEYYNAVWVKNEWSRFLKLMEKDKTKHLIPCYKGIDAYDMPREFAKLQAQDMGKVGAIQDLLRGIEKLLPKAEPAVPVVQEKVVVGNAGGSNKIASLLDRGNMALEDGDWVKAESFFEDVLNNDSRNAQAYIGKTLAQEKCRTLDALVRKRRDVYQSVGSETLYIPERQAHVEEMVGKYTLPGYVEEETIRELYDVDRSYSSEVSGREQQYREEESWWQNHRWLSRAEKFAQGAVAQTIQNEKKHLFAQLNDRVKKAEQEDAKTVAEMEQAYDEFLAETDAQAEKLYNDGIARREKDYEVWLEQAKKETGPQSLLDLAESFGLLYGYKDSKDLAEYCRRRADEERAKRVAEAKERAAREKKRIAIFLIATAAVIALGLIGKNVIHYRAAEKLQAEGDTLHAALTFGELGGFGNARERSAECWDVVAVRDTVSAGGAHTVGLKANGTVVAVGENGYGQCDVSAWTDIVAVSAGDDHTVGLKSDGTVVAVGSNSSGQCNVSDWTDIVAVSVGGSYTVGLKSDGTVVAVGSNMYGKCDVSDWTDIVAVSAGSLHTVGLKSDGTVVAVGYNWSGQCNVSGWRDIVAVSAGFNHTVGLKSDGTVVAVGDNDYGQCDVSGWRDIVAVSTGYYHTVGLKSDGTVVAVGWNDDGQCDVSSWTDIVAVCAGGWHTVGLKSDGTMVTTEITDDAFNKGQCDIGGWSDIRLPSISEEKKAAMVAAKQERKERLAKEYAAAEELSKSGQTAKAAIAFGKLGDYRDAHERCLSLWDASNNRKTISAGWYHTVGLKDDGTVIAVGSPEGGRCDISNWKNMKAISAGGYYTAGLQSDGTVLAVGFNDYNQLNVDGWTDIVRISSGTDHTVGLKTDGTVVAVGSNKYNYGYYQM